MSKDGKDGKDATAAIRKEFDAFVKLVQKMRECQDDYFKYRQP